MAHEEPDVFRVSVVCSAVLACAVCELPEKLSTPSHDMQSACEHQLRFGSSLLVTSFTVYAGKGTQCEHINKTKLQFAPVAQPARRRCGLHATLAAHQRLIISYDHHLLTKF